MLRCGARDGESEQVAGAYGVMELCCLQGGLRRNGAYEEVLAMGAAARWWLLGGGNGCQRLHYGPSCY